MSARCSRLDILLWTTVNPVFFVLGKVDVDTSACLPLNIQQRTVHQLEKLFKLNSITFFPAEYSIMVLSKGITGGENCRWHIAGHLSLQKRVCLIWLQSPMKCVINQSQSPVFLGKAKERDELALCSHPRVLWLPRLTASLHLSEQGNAYSSPVLEMVDMMGRCGPTTQICVRGPGRHPFLCLGERSLLSGAVTCAAAAESSPVHRAPTIPVCTNPQQGCREDGTRLGKGLEALPKTSCWELCAKMKSQRCCLNLKLRLQDLLIKGV